MKIRAIINNIPIISVIFRVANAYAYKGEAKHLFTTATREMWIERIWKGMVFSILIGATMSYSVIHYKVDNFDPEDAILSIFPDILGFGIGVFALLFALPTEFLSKLKESVNNSNGSNKIPGPEMLPADMAYPLLVYAVIMLLSVFFRALPDNDTTTTISCIMLMYGFVVTF